MLMSRSLRVVACSVMKRVANPFDRLRSRRSGLGSDPFFVSILLLTAKNTANHALWNEIMPTATNVHTGFSSVKRLLAKSQLVRIAGLQMAGRPAFRVDLFDDLLPGGCRWFGSGS